MQPKTVLIKLRLNFLKSFEKYPKMIACSVLKSSLGFLSLPLLFAPLSVFGNVQFSGGLDYFITLRNSSLSHGMTFSPSFVDEKRMFEKLNAELKGEIEVSIPSGFSKVVITWGGARWTGHGAGAINVPFIPKLKVDYGFSDVDGNFIKDRSIIKVDDQSGSVGPNPNGPTEIIIDWSKQKGSSNARIKFDIEENRDLLFKELVSRIPISVIRNAFASGGNDRYVVVNGTVKAKIEMFEKIADRQPVEIKDEFFPIQVHYLLENDIQISAVQGHDRLFFGRISLPSDKDYWLEIKPKNQTLANLSISSSSYDIGEVGKSSKVNLDMNDVIKNVGSLAAFEINGAPNVMKEPVFRCGNSARSAQDGSAGYLAQSFENGKYEAQIPIYIGKEHTKFLVEYNGGYSSYTLVVGGKILVSRNVPSGMYRSTCNVDLIMG